MGENDENNRFEFVIDTLGPQYILDKSNGTKYGEYNLYEFCDVVNKLNNDLRASDFTVRVLRKALNIMESKFKEQLIDNGEDGNLADEDIFIELARIMLSEIGKKEN